jgi:hypothetical protein
MICTIFYSLPSADDFSMAMGCSKNTLLLDSIGRANEYFMTWSGLWPYMFIETLINPVLLFPLESWWSGGEMVFLFLAFVVSFITVTNLAMVKLLGIYNKEHRCLFTLVILFVFFNTNIYNEIFYWFVGSSYLMALTLGIITIGLTIKLFFDEKMSWGGVIVLSVSGAVACNFFQAAILPGMVYIVLWCWNSIKNHRFLWKKTIPFWFMFTSGLIAVGAPGNYVRHAHMDSSVNIGKACIDATRMMMIILKHLLQQPLVIALLIFCVYIGIRYTKKRINGRVLLLTFFLSMLTLLLNSFPIALGYGGISYMPNRIYFLLDSTALIGLSVTGICLGRYVKSQSWYKECNSVYLELMMAGSVCLLLYSTEVYNHNINNLPWFQTLQYTKEVKQLHDSWIECLVTIRDAEEDTVEVVMDQGTDSSSILALPRISDQENEWVNLAVADFFGKKSVIVRIREE